MWHLLRIVVIDIESNDAQVIPETLNARGAPLLAADLIKNHLFPAFRKYPDRTNNSVEDIVKDIDYYTSIYETISESDRGSREGIFFHRLDILDTTTPYPVPLWIFGQKYVPKQQRRRSNRELADVSNALPTDVEELQQDLHRTS
jgi:hypothetical protein